MVENEYGFTPKTTLSAMDFVDFPSKLYGQRTYAITEGKGLTSYRARQDLALTAMVWSYSSH